MKPPYVGTTTIFWVTICPPILLKYNILPQHQNFIFLTKTRIDEYTINTFSNIETINNIETHKKGHRLGPASGVVQHGDVSHSFTKVTKKPTTLFVVLLLVVV